MLEAVERRAHLLPDVAVTRGELATVEETEEREVHCIDPVGVRGVHFRMDVSHIVREDIVDVAALVLIGADDLGVCRHVVGDQGNGNDTLPEAEVLRGMSGR